MGSDRMCGLDVDQVRLLDHWCLSLRAMFGEIPYLVGSCLDGPGFRDVDVRIMLEDEAFSRIPFKVLDLNMLLTLWGRRQTGLRVDCQVQSRSVWESHIGKRYPRFLTVFEKPEPSPEQIVTWDVEVMPAPIEPRQPVAAPPTPPPLSRNGNKYPVEHYERVAVIALRAKLLGTSMRKAVETEFQVSVSSGNNWVARAQSMGLMDEGSAQWVEAARTLPKGTTPTDVVPVKVPVSAPAKRQTEPETVDAVDVEEPADTTPTTTSTVGNPIAGHPKPAREHVPSVTADDVEQDPDVAFRKSKATHLQIAELYKDAYVDGRRPLTAIADRYGVDRKCAARWVADCRAVGLLPPRNQPPVQGVLPERAAVGAHRTATGQV